MFTQDIVRYVGGKGIGICNEHRGGEGKKITEPYLGLGMEIEGCKAWG